MTSTPAPGAAPQDDARGTPAPGTTPAAAPLTVVPPPSDRPLAAPPAAGPWWRRAKREPKGWAARSQRYVTWPWFLAMAAGDGLCLTIPALADLVLIKSTFDVVIGSSEVLSFLVALGLALVGALLALQAGRFMRKHVATREISLAGPLGLLGGWVLLGALLFWLRWDAASLNAAVTFEGETATADDGHQLMAVVLAGVHLATGMLAFASGWSLTNPEAYGLRTAMWMHRKVLRRLPTAEATVTRLAHNLGARLTEVTEAPRAMQNAQEMRQAVAAHVQAVARMRLAQHLADPTGTGVIRQPADVPIPLTALEPKPEPGP